MLRLDRLSYISIPYLFSSIVQSHLSTAFCFLLYLSISLAVLSLYSGTCRIIWYYKMVDPRFVSLSLVEMTGLLASSCVWVEQNDAYNYKRARLSIIFQVHYVRQMCTVMRCLVDQATLGLSFVAQFHCLSCSLDFEHICFVHLLIACLQYCSIYPG